MSILDRWRRFWKPAQWADDHALSAEEREESHELGFMDARGAATGATAVIDTDSEFRHP